MRVLLTGATGFVGRALIPLLQRDGHAVVAWVRSPASARSQLGAEVELVTADAGFDVLVRAIERCDAIVNLAGAPLMGGRWTAARRAGLRDVAVTYVGDWHADQRFIDANATHVRAALDILPSPQRQSARLVFTAHSIPVAMAGADRYRAQLTESARLVAARLGSVNWALVFQSRSGRPEDPWLGPDVCDYLRAERANGLEAAVLCPIGFVCDHVEVLYDLDHEAAAVCREIGLTMVRAEAVNDDPRFLDTMAGAVMQTWNRYRSGIPVSLAPASPPTRVEGPPPFRSAPPAG